MISLLPQLQERIPVRNPQSPENFSRDPSLCMSGGGGQNRTDDPLLAKQMLSLLSYAPDNGGPGKT